jgi:HK97 family phage major capsid protein
MKSNQELNQQLSEAVAFVDATRSEYAGKKVMPADVEARFDKAVADMLDAKKELELRSQIDNARSFQMAEGNNPSIMGGVAQDSKQEDALVRAWRGYLRGDNSQLAQIRAAQQVNPNTAGGFLVPNAIAQEIIKPVDNPIFMRQISNVQQINANVAIPRQNTRLTAYWQGETETALTSSVQVGQRDFKPHRVTVRTSASRLLIDQSVINVEQWLGGELDYASRLKEEDAAMQGNGVGQWLGIFTASADGIPTSRDVPTVGAAIAADDIISTLMNVKATVRDRGSWVGSRQFVTAVMKLKDSANQYIFTESAGIGNVLAVGTPMFLKGRPLYESESAPTTLAAGTYAAVFGDFNFYRIYDFLNLSVQVLDQDPYASNGEYGYVMHKFSDGAPVLDEAFSRLQVKP